MQRQVLYRNIVDLKTPCCSLKMKNKVIKGGLSGAQRGWSCEDNSWKLIYPCRARETSSGALLSLHSNGFYLTFPDLQWSAANWVASLTHRTSIPSTYRKKEEAKEKTTQDEQENKSIMWPLGFITNEQDQLLGLQSFVFMSETSSCRFSTIIQFPQITQTVCVRYHTWASDSCVHAHTCNCQDGLSASSCYSLGPHRPAAAYGRQTRCSYRPRPPTQLNHIKKVEALCVCRGAFVSHSDSWNEVSSLVVVGAGRRSLHRRPHAVLVVLTDEDTRQLPQGGHVERLEELTLVDAEKKEQGLSNVPVLTVHGFIAVKVF